MSLQPNLFLSLEFFWKTSTLNRQIGDPAFRLMRLLLDGELNFYLKNDFNYLRKLTWSHHLFLFYYFFLKKGKQNKKENPKCNSLFWKRWSVKNKIGLGGQVTYWEGTVRTVAPL